MLRLGLPKNDRLWAILAAVLALHMLTTLFAVYLWLVDRGLTELLKTCIHTGCLIRSNKDFARYISGIQQA